MAPFDPQENARGAPLAPPTLPLWGLKSCTRCALHSRWQLCCLTDVAYPLRVIGCGVHGFAMNPYVSTHPATAPYYREARVTFARRQTACRMRLCCARRIVGTGGRRELGCTSTRLAERQRIVGAEANRIAIPTAAKPRAGSCIPEAQRSFKLQTANLNLSLGGSKGGHSLL